MPGELEAADLAVVENPACYFPFRTLFSMVPVLPCTSTILAIWLGFWWGMVITRAAP